MLIAVVLPGKKIAPLVDLSGVGVSPGLHGPGREGAQGRTGDTGHRSAGL